MHELHEAGIVHGSIHPGNVLLAEEADGTLGGRLAEPGLSRVLMPGAVVPGAGRGGVLEFRDPDLLAGASPSRRTEVWALGATIHRALSGTGLYGELPGHPLGAIRELHSTPTRRCTPPSPRTRPRWCATASPTAPTGSAPPPRWPTASPPSEFRESRYECARVAVWVRVSRGQPGR